MTTGIAKPMTIGQTERVHVKVYGQDNTNNPSQVVDVTTPLTVTVPPVSAGALTAMVDPSDNRAVLITAIGATGGGFVVVNTTPSMPNSLTITVAVAAAPVEDRRVDFLSADDPT